MSARIRGIPVTTMFLLSLLVPTSAKADSWIVSNCAGPGGVGVGTPQMTALNGLSEHPEFVLVFWESNIEWINGTEANTRGMWIGSVLSLVNSPFYAQLTEYGGTEGMSLPRMAPYAPIWHGQPPNMDGDTTSNFTKADLESIRLHMISNNNLPAPSTADNTIYIFILPSEGFNDRFACNASGGCNYAYNGINYAYLPSGGAYDASLFGHETVERIAGYVNAQVSAVGCSNFPQGGQIADICQGSNNGDLGSGQDSLNGIKVGSYYSFERGLCIIPEYWGNLQVDTSQTGSWTTPAGDIRMRQMYGGAGGVLATSTDDLPYWYSQASGWVGREFNRQWQAMPISSTLGSEMAVGGGGIVQLGLDTSQGLRWASVSAPTTWHTLQALPGGASNPITSILETSGSVTVVTDQIGQPWYWDWNSNSWWRMGSPGDQFVVDGPDILGLTPDHVGIYRYGGYQFGNQTRYWVGQSNSGNPYVSLVGGPDDHGNWGAVSQSTYDLYYAGTTLVNWSGSGIVDWVSSYAAGGFMAQFGYVYQDYGAYFYPVSGGWNWNTTYGYAGRIIGGSDMYLAACAGPGLGTCVAYDEP